MTPFLLTLILSTGHYTFLDKGHPAPFPGILLDKTATAKVLAKARLCGEECNLKLKVQDDLLSLELQKDIDLLTITLDHARQRHKGILAIKDEEITKLRKLALNSGVDWTSLFIGAGIGATVSAVLIAVLAIAL